MMKFAYAHYIISLIKSRLWRKVGYDEIRLRSLYHKLVKNGRTIVPKIMTNNESVRLLALISKGIRQGVVVINPALNFNNRIFIFCVADNHLINSGVYNQSFTHCTA
jgi:hypothetical protein